MEHTIVLPSKLTPTSAPQLCSSLSAAPLSNSYIVDLSAITHAEPFGMLLASAALRRFAEAHRARGAQLKARGYEKNSYIAHMGFFQSFGLPVGKAPGEAGGSATYLPITRVDLATVLRAGNAPTQIDAVTHHSAQLTSMLLRQDSGPAYSRVLYSFREMIRNVVDHSRSDAVWYAAQFWPTQKRVEVAILDEGVGIRSSLARNPHYRVPNDLTAIRRALEEGVTGAPPPSEEELMQDPYAEAENTGYGLYIVSAMCSRAGAFSICSGDAIFHIDGTTKQSGRADHRGTAVRVVLKTSEVSGMGEVLDELTRKGGRRGASTRTPF